MGHCSEFPEAMKKRIIAIYAQERIINASTGEEIPPIFRKGGMKKLFELITLLISSVPTIPCDEGGRSSKGDRSGISNC